MLISYFLHASMNVTIVRTKNISTVNIHKLFPLSPLVCNNNYYSQSVILHF